MLYIYDAAGQKIEKLEPQYSPSPLGLVRTYVIGARLIIEAPDLFGPLEKDMAEKHIPAALQLKGFVVKPTTPKKEKR